MTKILWHLLKEHRKFHESLSPVAPPVLMCTPANALAKIVRVVEMDVAHKGCRQRIHQVVVYQPS